MGAVVVIYRAHLFIERSPDYAPVMGAHEAVYPPVPVIACQDGVVEVTVCYDLHILLLSYDLHGTAPASGDRQCFESAVAYVGHSDHSII